MKTFPPKISLQTGHFKCSGFILKFFSWVFFLLKYFYEFGLFLWWGRILLNVPINRIILQNHAVKLKVSHCQWASNTDSVYGIIQDEITFNKWNSISFFHNIEVNWSGSSLRKISPAFISDMQRDDFQRWRIVKM